MKTCNFCGNKNFTVKKAQYIYKSGSRFFVVNEVPCEECDFCGERYYEAATLKKIEHAFEEISRSGKKTSKEINVPVEEFAEL